MLNQEFCGKLDSMKAVAIYARVSTADQNTEFQIASLREYCERRNFTIYREYIDEVTGVISKRRPGKGESYKQLMRDARMRFFDVVLVWKYDRFARSLSDLIEGMQMFEALGIGFISVTQDIDTTTPMGKLFFHMVGSFAEFERDLIVERVKAGVDNARKKGVRLGRPRMSTPNQEDEIMDMWGANFSLSAISRHTGRSRAGVWLVIRRLGIGRSNDKPVLVKGKIAS
jgi:DNA invertase Pin-like site-specific DNA recombinase